MLRFESFRPKNVERRNVNAPMEYKLLKYAITYYSVTPGEAEDDEHEEDHGFEVDWTEGTFEDIKRIARDYGIYQDTNIHSNSWDSHGETTNYRTGEFTVYTLLVKHINDKPLNKEEIESISKLLKVK